MSELYWSITLGGISALMVVGYAYHLPVLTGICMGIVVTVNILAAAVYIIRQIGK